MDMRETRTAGAIARPSAMRPALTYVELVWLKGRIERWIRFGETIDEHIVDRRVRLVGFAPGAVFAFVRWAANDRGTIVSRIDILRAVGRTESCSTTPGVRPGGELLLRLSGWLNVAQVLRLVDGIEASGVEPAAVAPDFWRHVHNRLAAGLTPRSYSPARHRAWRLRQELLA